MYIVVTPVRDEAAHIERTIESMISQTVRPHRWIIVDDGSTDGTGAIVDRHAAQHGWIEVIHRDDRGYRAAGGGVMEAFHAGLVHADDDWEFLAKLDGDVSFGADYFERCFDHFRREATLGIAGGTVCQAEHGELRVDSVGDPSFHVRGATKIYRRACWQRTGPPVTAPGWDTVDEIHANRFGWRTRTFPDLKVQQHKPTGSADGRWKNAIKNGKANYLTGYHPVFMAGKCLRRALRPPVGVEATGLMTGFVMGYLRRLPRLVDRETIAYLREQQLRRIFAKPSIYGE